MASNALEELRSLLKDVQIHGTVTVNKRKLLWLLGWGQDRPDTWQQLLNHWQEIGAKREDLHGFEVSQNIVLSLPVQGGLVPINAWSIRR